MYNDPNQPPQPNPYEVPPTQYPTPQSPYEVPTQYAAPQYNQPAYGAPPYNPPGATPYNPVPYGAPPAPGYAQAPQPPKKKSLRWLWITLSIIGGVLVLSCAGCITLSVLGYNIFAPTVGSTVTANSYYQAIEGQDYTKAYSYLASNMTTTGGQALTQSLYTSAAQAKDTLAGPVTSFTQTSVTTNNGTATITMSVVRSGQSYVVHLELQQINGNWLITQFDRI